MNEPTNWLIMIDWFIEIGYKQHSCYSLKSLAIDNAYENFDRDFWAFFYDVWVDQWKAEKRVKSNINKLKYYSFKLVNMILDSYKNWSIAQIHLKTAAMRIDRYF